MGDLSAVEEAGAFGAGDGSDSHAVDDAGNELADAVGVGKAGQNGAVCDLSQLGEFLLAHVLFEQFLGFGDVGAIADFDGQIGYGVDACNPAHSLEKLIEGFGFADAEVVGGLDRLPGGVDDFSDVFLHGMCPPDGFFHCALLGINGRQSWRGFLGVYVVCFVEVLGGTGIFGFDRTGDWLMAGRVFAGKSPMVGMAGFVGVRAVGRASRDFVPALVGKKVGRMAFRSGDRQTQRRLPGVFLQSTVTGCQ